MRHSRLPALALGVAALALTACGSTISTSGVNAKEFFLLEDGYNWQYTHAEHDEMFEAWYLGESTVEGESVHILSWKYDTEQNLAVDESELDPALFFMDTYWSKSEDGVLFWGAATVQDGPLPAWDDVFYSDSLLFAGVDLYPGDEESSNSNGEDWTSVYVDSVDTVETFGGTFSNALQITFDDVAEQSPFGGDWYLARNTGIVQFQVRSQPDELWILNKVRH